MIISMLNTLMSAFLLAVSLCCISTSIFASSEASADNQAVAADVSKMPSKEELNELLNKASEYVQTYKLVYAQAKLSLDKAVPSGFHRSGMELVGQANSAIAKLKSGGYSGYGLVVFIAILDDMSLNAAKATSAVMLLTTEQQPNDPNAHGMSDFQDLAAAGKNCSDISELLLHATLRYIAGEESLLKTFMDRIK